MNSSLYDTSSEPTCELKPVFFRKIWEVWDMKRRFLVVSSIALLGGFGLEWLR